MNENKIFVAGQSKVDAGALASNRRGEQQNRERFGLIDDASGNSRCQPHAPEERLILEALKRMTALMDREPG